MSLTSFDDEDKCVCSVKFGCTGALELPLTDADNDNVTCRWSVGNECVSVCHASGSATVATLDQVPVFASVNVLLHLSSCNTTFVSSIPQLCILFKLCFLFGFIYRSFVK